MGVRGLSGPGLDDEVELKAFLFTSVARLPVGGHLTLIADFALGDLLDPGLHHYPLSRPESSSLLRGYFDVNDAEAVMPITFFWVGIIVLFAVRL